MKNLFLIGSMMLFFGYASAQETPAKVKQSTTKTDTVQSKKTKKSTTKSSTTTHKTDSVSQRNGQKKGKMKSSTTTTTQRDSLSGIKTP
jgi:uncharacterized membrane protein